MIDWRWATLGELSGHDLYTLLAARQAVFVVEQNCPYLDADGQDFEAIHLLGWVGATLAATLRLLPPGTKYVEPAIGRVLVMPPFRGQGLGQELMREGIRQAQTLYPAQGLRISAQAHLADFYARLGFAAVGDLYDEDGIPHVEMRRP